MKNRYTLLLLLSLTIFGAVITPHFGESWDELKFYKYAATALRAYRTWPTEGTVQTFGNTYDEYGPAFVRFVVLAAKPLRILFIESDARHYLYFLTFLAGVWAFYGLCSRWLSPGSAAFSTLLFATQPLFIGHAFISPKDMPFLSFFLMSMHLGLRLFDRPLPKQNHAEGARGQWNLFVLTILWMALILMLYLFTDSVHRWIEDLVRAAKAGETNLLSLIASDIGKAEAAVYVQRYFLFFLWARSLLFLVSSVLLLVVLHRRAPAFFHSLPAIILPAAILGITTSIRVLGPFAAVFIASHALRKHGRQALASLAAYAILAVITCYLTWPYLWPNPLGHLIESLLVMSRYPWNGQVLFNGTLHASTDLPIAYLPTLLGIQFTEPVWALTVLGLAAAVKGPGVKRQLLPLALVWLLIPLLGFILGRAPLYDNFRQIFFVLPPIFILAGAAFDQISDGRVRIALMTLCLLPGLLDAVRLHPYEYIYYNRFIGGVNGAFRKYELDYWGTSYREAAQDINESAPANATIWADGPAHILEAYAREDLRVYSGYEPERADRYDYVVSTSRYNLDQTSHPEAEIVHMIKRDGAILTVIKQP
ncbi:MAG: hypothetical protein FJZ87_01500 [Chloroflexi bacterium]|nr:hypothetical protein [Chloroflexota bacterium]